MKLFWGEGFLNQFLKFMIFVMIVLLCWGWISHVALGRMTTGQYFRKMSIDFRQGLFNMAAEIQSSRDRIVRNMQTWGQH
jgi:hypothetical protein